jgi:hypothetical protein
MAKDPYTKKREQEYHRQWIHSLIASAQTSGWYGTLVLKFEGGDLKAARQDASLIPPKVPKG